ncbi:uncharacterized protein LOC142645367 [Dermatophagoides pteronyssinus]|uniref:uncharacterized protein LOC142645367 n=1 Tax=Dermatophagoides pteronyssinus TaxID=6956 RepID=UPI003F66372E
MDTNDYHYRYHDEDDDDDDDDEMTILNILLAILSMTIQSYRWSIILLQIISSLFTFSYLLSMYLKMKLDILHKRRLQQRLEELQTSNMMKRRFLVTSTTLDENVDDHIYQIAPSIKPPPEFNPIELTNEWIINHNHNHQNNNSMLLQQNPENEQNEFDSKRIISTPTTNSI